MKEKIVLAYSGGLDTSIIIPWLKENFDFEIIAACINVGQNEDMEEIKIKAIESGASKVYVEDVVEEFIEEFIYKSIKASAVYEGKYLMGTSLARPLIGKKLVEIANKENAKYIAHGCTGKGNDQVRFENTIASIAPDIKVIAPWRIWDIKSREDAIDYAQKKGIKLSVTKEKIYSRDQNIMHISHEGGSIEDPSTMQPKDLLLMVTPIEEVKSEGDFVEIEFKNGIPIKLNSNTLSNIELFKQLNFLGSLNGIGVVDILENRVVGMKSRGIYETPGASILMYAHNELERLTLDKLTYQYKQIISLKYAELVYMGTWFCTLKNSLDAFIEETQKNVNGKVKLKLYKGNIILAGMESPCALYEHSISSFGSSDFYDQKDAAGFLNLFNLPFKIEALMKNKN